MRTKINRNQYLTEGFIYKENNFLYYVNVQEKDDDLKLLHSTKKESNDVYECFKDTFKNEIIYNGCVYYFKIYKIRTITRIMYVSFDSDNIRSRVYNGDLEFAKKMTFARYTVYELIHMEKTKKKIKYQ